MGHSDSQVTLGLCYHYGNGKLSNIDDDQRILAALDLFKKAQAQGNPQGQYWLGLYYLFGYCVQKICESSAFSGIRMHKYTFLCRCARRVRHRMPIF